MQDNKLDNSAINSGMEVKKPKKLLKLKTTAKAFNPDEELNEKDPAPTTQYSLMDDLKTTNSGIQKSSAAFTPAGYNQYMPYNGMPIQQPAQFQMPTAQAMQYPQSADGHDSYEHMFQSLIEAGMVDINPKVYNQPQPGQDVSMNMQMHAGLQDFVDEFGQMTQEEMCDAYQEMMESEFGNRPEYDFEDDLDRHTYSHLDDEDETMDDPEQQEDPSLWHADPEAAKRREEIRKNLFNPTFKDCTCCKGYISNCNNQICKDMGVCHCVVRKQNEETHDIREFIPECQSCKCCNGHVYACVCVSSQGKTMCKCLT